MTFKTTFRLLLPILVEEDMFCASSAITADGREALYVPLPVGGADAEISAAWALAVERLALAGVVVEHDAREGDIFVLNGDVYDRIQQVGVLLKGNAFTLTVTPADIRHMEWRNDGLLIEGEGAWDGAWNALRHGHCAYGHWEASPTSHTMVTTRLLGRGWQDGAESTLPWYAYVAYREALEAAERLFVAAQNEHYGYVVGGRIPHSPPLGGYRDFDATDDEA